MTVLAAALLLAAPLAAPPGSAGPDRSPFRVERLDSPAPSHAAIPSLARGADGVVRLAWIEHLAGGGARVVVAALEGTRFGTPSEVARDDSVLHEPPDVPAVAALADGTVAVAWVRRSDAGREATEIACSLSARPEAGAERVWSAPELLHDDRSPTEHGFPSLAALDAGHFLAIWLDGRGRAAGSGAQSLRSRTLARDGTPGPDVEVDARVCDCCQTSLVRAGEGVLFAAWRDRSEEEVRDIRFARYESGRWGAARAVHDDGWKIAGCPVNGPRLAAADGKLACAWYHGGDGAGTWAAFADDSGFTLPRRIDDGTGEGHVDAVFLADGSLLVAWLEHAADGVEWRVRAFAPDGRAGPPVAVAPTTSDRGAGLLRMVPLGDGALLAWPTARPRGIALARLVPEPAGSNEGG